MKIPEFNETLQINYIKSLNISPRAADNYLKAVTKHNEWLNKNNITSPEKNDIINYMNDISLYLKSSTVRMHMSSVKSYYRFLQHSGLYQDITAHMKISFTMDKNISFIAYEHLEKLENKCFPIVEEIKGLRDRLIFLLAFRMLLTGNEMQRLNIHDIEVQNRILTFRIRYDGGDYDYVETDQETEEILKLYLSKREEYLPESPLLIGLSPNKGPQLNDRLTSRSISRVLTTAYRASGFEGTLTPDLIRRSVGIYMLDKGASSLELKRRMRFKSLTSFNEYLKKIEEWH